MIRILSDADTAAFLSRHPEITADPDIVSTWGLRVIEGSKDYIVCLPRAGAYKGRLRVMDATVYDPETGERIDPTVVDETSINLFLRSIVEGIAESGPDLETLAISLAIFVVAGFVAYKLIIDRR